MDRRCGLESREGASKEILGRWLEKASEVKLWLDSGLSSDSKEGSGESWTDIVAEAGWKSAGFGSWRRPQLKGAFGVAKVPSSKV